MYADKKELILNWANKNISALNKLAYESQTVFYTQSPLNQIDSDIETLILGINPKGEPHTASENVKEISVDDFLNGNSCWSQRFADKSWHKFVMGTRKFLGYDSRETTDAIDLNNKTVWANLVPFPSMHGFKDLSAEQINTGIECTLELIDILKPERIVLLTKEGSLKLQDKKINETLRNKIKFIRVLESPNLEIGLIDGVHTVCINHPSQKWPVSNLFPSIFLLIHKLSFKDGNGKIRKNLEEVCDIMRREFKALLQIVVH